MYRFGPYLEAIAAMASCALSAGCMPEGPLSSYAGSLGGQVVVAGPLRGAAVSVVQLDLRTGEPLALVGETATDDQGRFSLDAGISNGILRVTARGGIFVDPASGATIQLDPADELSSLVRFDLADSVSDALVGPIGHLIDARARVKQAILGDMSEALADASSHLGRHFGDVRDWSRLELAGLSRPATSPTEQIRAALVHAALGVLARDIAAEAGGSPQEINVFELAQRWAADLGRDAPGTGALPRFDGNDGNDRSAGSGLQLGACAPAAPTCEVPAGACNTGHCRRLCDLYVGSPRALLAGAMTKIIRDNGPGGVNQTGLEPQDTLAIARSVSDNVDPDLFGGACIETLDRTAPEVRWDEAQSVASDAVVRGTFQARATAVDDVDPRPRVQLAGYADADGDPFNGAALARVDTAGLEDGPLTLTASAIDLAGNAAAISRRVFVDNTPPQLSLSSDGFLVDGATWWTAAAAPVLAGAVSDAHPATVVATIGGTQVTGTIAGGAWSVTLPAGAIDLIGADVTITVADRAGNRAERTQRIRRDATPPELSLQASLVTDEAAEIPAFAPDGSPIHSHSGAPIDLAVAGACPVVTKYSYLLGAATPPHAVEQPARNPLAYRLVAADDGIGLSAGSTQYRIRRRGAGGSTVVLDWTSAGAGAPIGSGARLFDVAIVSDLVSALAETEAVYDVELRTTDRLARTTTESRCFELRLRAPPLQLTASGSAVGHAFALDSLNLAPGAPHDRLAARLLNNDATGASLIDHWFTNGTTATIFLTATVTKPTAVTATQSFEIRNYTSTAIVGIECYDAEDNWNPACNQAQSFPSAGYVSSPVTTGVTAVFPVRLYELDAAGAPMIEVPCLAPCSPGGGVFRFAVPPRIAGGPARRFVAMTMVGQVVNLWPSDGASQASAPFSDTVVNGVRYTGKTQFNSSGCSKLTSTERRCIERITRIQYRALRSASLRFGSFTEVIHATAPTALLAPAVVTSFQRPQNPAWSTQEGSLP